MIEIDRLRAALRELHAAVDEEMGDTDLNEDDSKLFRAMRRAAAEMQEPEPGAPILDTDCPCCGAILEIQHGDEPGDVGIVWWREDD